MRNLNQDTITEAVLARFANTPDPRLKEIISSLVTHLHNFARDVKLTEEEWFYGIQYLTATGHKCTDVRQEFILLSDVLGLSMLTIAMNQDKPAGCTEPTVFGPFFLENAPHFELGAEAPSSMSGKPMTMANTMCSMKTCHNPKREVFCRQMTKVIFISPPSWPRPIPSRPMAPWAPCSMPPNATRGGPPICISWSKRPATSD